MFYKNKTKELWMHDPRSNKYAFIVLFGTEEEARAYTENNHSTQSFTVI